MAMRHYIYITDEDSGDVLYKTMIFGYNYDADDEFYYNLGIEINPDGSSDFTDVDMKTLFKEWSLYLSRFYGTACLEKTAREIREDAEDDEICKRLYEYQNHIYFQMMRVYGEMLPYADKYSHDEMSPGYRLTIKLF